ncbi:bifunctional diaminohydroxyphosphoribosylaminopyrimidine deaminase/5-amino-6-(5-phosphoribosylamino)uracil reductase RibD [Pusillimonas sp. MFBS29]|uniref:bifunctional diaminohydroxyphosphoribosylaminopyrimidine deaminase/5-amino-6-(5-phosphoribosylamino)uracil reductase RibD n=1 Tax=Pusillimonas sp. MFBS29 TaxID=2886690 RepID=UPI001D0FA946|nr:bifunctional diaminohydroxyphosphoribosylaminopyrimidine deaminase/5-amino-6-(5-phosphoribosylamino)uracil reductase RibD [Pusillimonas sp. MFBS29]MCC2597024.1 bifunctional diaminohydroxyphosphoribosylaminopyrimidine deaminase/5-amino-6-(5-phosphoribosylamino)uracil reductase RibD [Pusillimonas sp. MFBS29]
MRQALTLAASVLYVTAPNPRVACLIVRDERLLASGATQKAGGPHAEVMALRQAAEQGVSIAGTTVYVTLEPCSHHGRTPPCVDALIAARPARVVIAMTDPNPLVGGQGVARLRAAGIPVTTDICTEEALALNPGFVARMTRKTPWAWLKLAASLDGRIALPNGESQWITGPAARADGHHWRARSCVVLTGVGTVLADDPQMNVRHVETARPPIKAIVDTRFQVAEHARIFDGTPAWVFTCLSDPEKAARLADRNVRVIELPSAGGRVDLSAMMRWMGEQSINEVHVEAGARLSGALAQAHCADELLVYMAPMLLGDGIGMASLEPLQKLAQAQRFEFVETTRLAPDVRLRARQPDHWNTLLQALQHLN